MSAYPKLTLFSLAIGKEAVKKREKYNELPQRPLNCAGKAD
ncbi:MAG: hypothetical protein AAGG51_21685 [Cyanobacteria bacterium P01_G01_bin.54]